MTSAMRFSALAAEARSANVKRAMSALIMSWDPQQLTRAPGGEHARVRGMQSFPWREINRTALGGLPPLGISKEPFGGRSTRPFAGLQGLLLRAHLSAGGETEPTATGTPSVSRTRPQGSFCPSGPRPLAGSPLPPAP